MALILCPKCGNKISSKAKKCPKCGYSTIKIILRRVRNITLALSIITVVIAGCIFAYLYFDTDRVKDYTGQEYTNAIEEVSEFDVKCKMVSSNKIPENEIINQEIIYDGRKINQIIFTVSAGDKFAMPNLIGMNIIEAVQELHDLNIYDIQLQKSDRRKNLSFSENAVCSQSVKSGSEIGVEEKIVLKTYENNYEFIPDLKGTTVTFADKELRELGFDCIIYDSGANAKSKISDIQDPDEKSIIQKVYNKHDYICLKIKK